MNSDSWGRRHRSAFFLGVVCLAACGGSVVPQPTQSRGNPIVVLDPPSLRIAAPGRVAAGDTITVLGSGFQASAEIVLRIEGTFRPDLGPEENVNFTVPARYVDSGRVEWDFEPEVPPLGFGNSVGVLRASVTAIQSEGDVASDPSPPMEVTLDVGPSLILWSAAPENIQCGERFVGATLVRDEFGPRMFEIEAEAIGLEEPIEMRVSWLMLGTAPDVNAPLPESERIRELMLIDRHGLFTLDPGYLPFGDLSGNVQVSLFAEDATGVVLQRNFNIEVRREYTIEYDGNVELRELFAPVQVSSCLPGGEFGRNVSYNGGQTESRSRTLGLSANVNFDLWVIDAGFGFNTSETVSSSESESLSVSGRVPPGQFGVFYRQTERLERTGFIVRSDVCGNRTEVGRAFVTDWNWAPDLALTSNGACPPAPPSNLPPAEVFR
ncbi:MAG: hypothetical protein AAF654_11760 [Myxococcota bacterium]